MKVVDNFLDKNEFTKIKDVLMSNNFPWFYQDVISSPNDQKDHYYFTHIFFDENKACSDWFNLWENFLSKIECKALIRVKGNLHVRHSQVRTNKKHADYPYAHKGCLFYINKNNGYTLFDKERVLPKENRAVFFNPNEPHQSSRCSDQNIRMNINFNYF